MAALVLGYQAVEARTALVNAAARFEEVGVHVRLGHAAAARDAVQEARREARHADRMTGGLLWGLATRTPVLGDDMEAVRTVAQVARGLADNVLMQLVTASEELDPARLRPRDGRVDLGPLVRVRDEVVAADRELKWLASRAARIDTASLVPQLAGPVSRLQHELSEAATVSSRASYAVRLLPPMLGNQGPRTYLVLFQNNAEMRATGGIPGAVAVMRAENGRVTIESQGTVADLGFQEVVATSLTDEELALYGTRLLTYGADIGLTPDFPRVAELAQARWLAVQGQHVDGVVATDPVALSYLLRATGPVTLPDGSALTAANAVDRLLSKVYLTQPDPDLQDVFFAGVARVIFRHAMNRSGDAGEMLEALTRAAEEGRLLVWSSRSDEQALLAETSLAGALPRESGPSPFIGVFLNDGTAAKMEYYLEHRVDVSSIGCDRDGRQRLELRVTLTSRAPEDAAQLPESVIGDGETRDSGPRVPPGHMRLTVHVYAPVGGAIESSARDGRFAPLDVAEHLGHPVGAQTVDLAPGETHELTYRLLTGPSQPGRVSLRVTPGAHDGGVGTVGRSACRSTS